MTEELTLAVPAAGAVSFTAGDGALAARERLAQELRNRRLTVNLRNADEQNMAGLAAVVEALRTDNVSDYTGWGVVAAPRVPGRAIMAAALSRFGVDGAWGVSPHVIPQCSLHSLAGLVSVTFGLRGANFGAGGLPGREGDAFAALPALLDQCPAGVWVVLAGWQRGRGGPATDSCRAVALAVTAAEVPAPAKLTLTYASGGRPTASPISLESLYRAVALDARAPIRCRWALPGGGQLVWRRHGAALEVAA